MLKVKVLKFSLWSSVLDTSWYFVSNTFKNYIWLTLALDMSSHTWFALTNLSVLYNSVPILKFLVLPLESNLFPYEKSHVSELVEDTALITIWNLNKLQ